MLKSILMVWVLALNPEDAARTYSEQLGFVAGETGTVSSDLAHTLARPELAGRSFYTVYPEQGPATGIRWVEGGASAHRPMQRLGWSAIELLVRDPDTLVATLAGSNFRRLEGPAYLTEAKNVRAAQVLGPANELLYVTRILDPTRSILPVSPPSAAVGHPFIMVAGTADLDATRRFFDRHFANAVTDRIPFRIDVLSAAYGLPEDTQHDLALVKFAEPYGFEFDQYPAEAAGQPLPPAQRGGVVLVTVSVDPASLPGELPWTLRYLDSEGEVAGGVVLLPSGTPLEIRFQ